VLSVAMGVQAVSVGPEFRNHLNLETAALV
jgi:hypothetical protein